MTINHETTLREEAIMGEKKTNALSKSMKLIYVYAMATGAIFTFMCYWDGIFMSYTGPGTFLAFALMTLAVLPTAFVYAEFSTMLPSTGSCLVFNTVGINKHAGFWSAWLIMCAWIAVPAAGVLYRMVKSSVWSGTYRWQGSYCRFISTVLLVRTQSL